MMSVLGLRSMEQQKADRNHQRPSRLTHTTTRITRAALQRRLESVKAVKMALCISLLLLFVHYELWQTFLG